MATHHIRKYHSYKHEGTDNTHQVHHLAYDHNGDKVVVHKDNEYGTHHVTPIETFKREFTYHDLNQPHEDLAD